jgi:hypothetical protein
MSGRISALDKCTGVRPVRVGKTWCRHTAKFVLLVVGAEAKEACSVNQLCAGLEAGIEGGIHAMMQALWDLHETEGN